jgi:hypothetical protein
MNIKLRMALAAAFLSGVAASGVLAQGQRQGGGRPQDPGRQSMPDRSQDRDRTMDRDRTVDRDQDRDRDRDRDQDRDRDRIYAAELMSEQERTAYHDRLRALATEQERIEYRLQHQREMQARAQQRGVKAGTPPTRAQLEQQERLRQQERQQVYGYSLMSQAELERYRERMRAARNDGERAQIRAEHQREMQERARQRGVTLPPAQP